MHDQGVEGKQAGWYGHHGDGDLPAIGALEDKVVDQLAEEDSRSRPCYRCAHDLAPQLQWGRRGRQQEEDRLGDWQLLTPSRKGCHLQQDSLLGLQTASPALRSATGSTV